MEGQKASKGCDKCSYKILLAQNKLTHTQIWLWYELEGKSTGLEMSLKMTLNVHGLVK